MTPADPELRFLAEALPQFQAYLLSNELYWPLSGSLPRLTPGSLLLNLKCAGLLQPDPARKSLAQYEMLRAKWRIAWEKKVIREMSNRLHLWENFVSDCELDLEKNAASYPAEVRGRTILQLLLFEFADLSISKALTELDAAIKSHLTPHEFLWDARLQVVFPAADFWFLYGKL